MDLPDGAINVFMGIPGDGDRLELTWNPGVESYDLGTGYNHIALDRRRPRRHARRAGRARASSPRSRRTTSASGGPRICFVRDPDGYRVELIERGGGV